MTLKSNAAMHTATWCAELPPRYEGYYYIEVVEACSWDTCNVAWY